MIYGIGTDIVNVARITKSIERHGDKFAKRILSDDEYYGLSESTCPEKFLAKRFAAKEAAAKALGTGFRNGLSLRHIAVSHDVLGKPELVFSDYAEQLRYKLGIGSTHLSLSDEREYALHLLYY